MSPFFLLQIHKTQKMDSNNKKNQVFGLVKMQQGTSKKMTNTMRRMKNHVKKTTIITPIPTTETKNKVN